jgi:hypothetical protein
MSGHDLSARLPTFGPSLVDAGYASLIELERLAEERLIMAGLHNDIVDLVRHFKIRLFRRIELGYITEIKSSTMNDYMVEPGGLYLFENGVLKVSDYGNHRV